MLCRAYDQAAIKFRGVNADINFTLTDYKDEIKKVMITDQSHCFLFVFKDQRQRSALFICICPAVRFCSCHGIAR
jgi:hypothetical protein